MAAPGKSRKSRHAATLADVGREAGVSAMAASAVLNGAKTSSRISEDTRDRILEAAKRLNYRPNAAARALAERRMNTIGVATVHTENELNQYFLEVFNGVIEAAAKVGQNTTVFALPDWKEGAKRIPAICDGRIDGLILLAPWLEADSSKYLPDHTPFVSVHANADLPGVTNLESDEEVGAFEAIRHLFSLGHRRILYIAGSRKMVGARRRIEGYLRAHAVEKIKADPDLLVESDYYTESGRVAMAGWLERHRGKPLPDAVFCANDANALGVMETLLSRGLRIPADISVVGFDDTLLARSSGLATVRQPLREMGHQAVELLVARIEAKHADSTSRAPKNIVLPTSFVAGNSLSAPRTPPLVVS